MNLDTSHRRGLQCPPTALTRGTAGTASTPGMVWNGLNNWNGLTWNGLNSYPYGVNQWSSAAAWPATYSNGYTNNWYGLGGKTVVQANVAKVNPWGLPLASSYGYGYNNYLGAAIPAAKYVAANPGSVHVAPLVGHAINQKLIVA
ncbi:hypothetical protein pipiens_012143 [Culex pipiens pipiens]|uniref:Uncharacterized protein n=1 Tax=Culex pipiens pipiens TaxID=38569 RepID=A0ABD1D3Z3_CULPP